MGKRTGVLAAAVAAVAMVSISASALAGAAGSGEAMVAFPGAEGFGAASVGGRGGKVIKVTTLAASGPGSLQEALSTPGPRVIVFEVSGVIAAPKRGKYRQFLITEGQVTIAGQTAPGRGVTLEGMLATPYKGKPLSDITVRFVRVRPPAATAIGEGGDCIQITGAERVILDHVSCSWGSDENVDLCNTSQITVQWCAIEESDTAGHVEGQHNFGMIMGYAGRDASVHHNLFAHHKDRAPLCGLELLDHRNNVIYNYKVPLQWHPPRMNQRRPGQPFKANVVGNFFKAGPDVPRDAKFDSLDRLMWKRPWVSLYAADNFYDWTGRTANPSAGVPDPASSQPDTPLRVEAPWPAPAVTTHSARQAYELVLAQAGALPRDAVGRRTVEEVRAGGGRWGRREPEGGLAADFKPADPPADADADGLPDDWERAHRLDPRDPADAARVVPAGASEGDRHRGYTFIEFYINERADRLIAQAAAEAASAAAGPAESAAASVKSAAGSAGARDRAALSGRRAWPGRRPTWRF